MANRRRGDVALELGGERLVLRLTLGALAEIETALGASDLAALGERLQAGRLAARDLIPILGAAARGGGLAISDAALAARIDVADLPACVAAVGELFTLTFGEGP